MYDRLRFVSFVLILGFPLPGPAASPVAATVETTLTSADVQIRMLAFDGDPNTYFASKQNPGPDDHFTLVFDQPVAVTAIVAFTGRPAGGDQLEMGNLGASAGGKTFKSLVPFVDGVARFNRPAI